MQAIQTTRLFIAPGQRISRLGQENNHQPEKRDSATHKEQPQQPNGVDHFDITSIIHII